MIVVLAVYSLLIVAASIAGGHLPRWIQLTHNRLQFLISFVGGLMLGIALFHLLPHSISSLGAAGIDQSMLFVMLGLVAMFFLLRMFHFHNHDTDLSPHVLNSPGSGITDQHHSALDHDHHHDVHCHEHEKSARPQRSEHPPHPHHLHASHELSWMGVFVGLSIHTLIDGFALGASIKADSLHASGSLMTSLGTFLAILLHKPLDAVSITSLMRASHWSEKSQMAVNAAFAMMCPMGAALFVCGAELFREQQGMVIGSMLGFSAGVFLCISLSDLLPEMEFHSHNRVSLSLALLLGVAVAWGIGWLEPAGAHQPLPASKNFRLSRVCDGEIRPDKLETFTWRDSARPV